VPQWQWAKPTAQTGTKQPSVSPNMTPMNAAPMTPMSPVDQRIAGLQDRMSTMPTTQMPQADTSAFSLDQIFGKGQNMMKPQIWVDFGTGLPTGQQVTEQMPQVREWIAQWLWETGKINRSQLKVMLEAVPQDQRVSVVENLINLWTQIEWLNYEPEQQPNQFDKAKDRVNSVLWEEWTQGFEVAGRRFDMTQPMRTAAMAWIDAMEWVSEAFARRQAKIDDIINAELSWEQTKTRSNIQALFQSMGFWWDIVSEWFMAWLKVLDQAMWWAGSALLSKVGETEAAKQWLAMLWEWLEKYNEYAEQNPVAARDIDAMLWAADFMLNFVWVGLTGKWVQQARRATRATGTTDMQKIISRTPLAQAEEIAKIAKVIEPEVWFLDKAISQVAKIDPQTANTLRKNKWLVVYGDAQWWNTETVSQGVLDTLQKNMDRFSEAGQAYTAIRESWQMVDMQPIKNRVTDALKKEWITVSPAGELIFPAWLKKFDSADQKLIKEAVEAFLKEGDAVEVWKFLDGRMLLSKQARFDANITKSKDATDYIKRLRGEISDEAKKQIGGLSQADKVYAGINDSVDGLLREFYTSQGTQKGNITSKIKQIMRRLDSDPQKQALLRTVPDIDDKLKYLSVMDDLAKSQWNKVATYMASTLPLWWFVAGWPIGWALWFLASTYFAGWDVVKNLLLKFGKWWDDIAKKIANKVSKQQKLLDNEQKIIQEAIENARQSAPELLWLPAPTATPIAPWWLPQQWAISPMPQGTRQVIEWWQQNVRMPWTQRSLDPTNIDDIVPTSSIQFNIPTIKASSSVDELVNFANKNRDKIDKLDLSALDDAIQMKDKNRITWILRNSNLIEQPKAPTSIDMWYKSDDIVPPARTSNLDIGTESVMLKAPEDALIQEARKYKSAEEFVKNQNIIYRGWSSEGMYYTTDKSIAEDFAKNRWWVVKEYILPKWVKKIDYNDVPGVEFKDIDNYTVWRYALPRKKTILDFMENDLEKDYTKATKWAKDNWYDIITFPTEWEIRTISSDIVKEKSQLKQIREQANK
jgi:hypothetical protein